MIPMPHQALLGIQEKFDGHCDPTVGLLSLRPMNLPQRASASEPATFLVGTNIFLPLP